MPRITDNLVYSPFDLKENKNDYCAYVIICDRHGRVAISYHHLRSVWLPFTPIAKDASWNEASMNGVVQILTDGQTNLLKSPSLVDRGQCMQVFRLQLPQSLNFVTRLIYCFKLKQFDCCQDSSRIKWFPINEILNCQVNNLWGPELITFTKLAQSPIIQQVFEYSLEEAFFFIPYPEPRNIEETILKSAQITENDVERLYGNFVEHCFPSFYQTFHSFECFMAKYGFEKNDHRLKLLFNAFNLHGNGFISFHELLLGLATIEPNTIHGEWRVKFIFRYYNLDNTGYLTMVDMRKMITDIHPDFNSKQIDFELNESLKLIGTQNGPNGQPVITRDDFVAAVGARRFRGTSKLCRSNKSIFAQISRMIAARQVNNQKHKIIPIIKQFKGNCLSCKQRQYRLASHSVRIDSEGSIVDSQKLVNDEEKPNEISSRKYSMEFVFNPHSAPNVLIKLIRQFNMKKGNNQLIKGLLQDDRDLLLNLVMALCNDMDILLDHEQKCQFISSPCYIFGDIHGNLEDLLSFEQAIWKRMPCLGANYLFLGDYVDRGHWGLECCLYLFSFKILCPNNVILLRGNHEVRTLQTHYTYKKECIGKYGIFIGTKIWEMTNKIFDKLPVCCIVDDAIFCAHGGIPKTTKLIKDINEIPKKVFHPEKESAIVWEMLWSDPCHDQQFIEMCNFMKIDSKETEGFLPNLKRGTAFLFNEFAMDTFLQNNGLSHLIRAHEVSQNGFMFHFGTKCTTIFSCSHYCGNNNECACILVQDQTIRMIHLDTANNTPATD